MIEYAALDAYCTRIIHLRLCDLRALRKADRARWWPPPDMDPPPAQLLQHLIDANQVIDATTAASGPSSAPQSSPHRGGGDEVSGYCEDDEEDGMASREITPSAASGPAGRGRSRGDPWGMLGAGRGRGRGCWSSAAVSNQSSGSATRSVGRYYGGPEVEGFDGWDATDGRFEWQQSILYTEESAGHVSASAASVRSGGEAVSEHLAVTMQAGGSTASVGRGVDARAETLAATRQGLLGGELGGSASSTPARHGAAEALTDSSAADRL
jgi:hypothetical protein